MRPIRVGLRNFTAFRGEHELELADLEVFAVAGPTGAGKSSLLDAITYALFGRVERVGDRVRQLISQGQPRMAVALEFESGNERCRVVRTTFSDPKRATKVSLERRVEGEWISFGEGADRVRDTDALIEHLVGLDYMAFTRSVLLPQGRFSEFLAGDASDRRAILTELLGLSLFTSAGKRARTIGAEASAGADAREEMLEREYEGMTTEALAAAKGAAKQARGRERALAKAEAKVEVAARSWERAERAARELVACAAEAREMAETAARAEAEAAGLAEKSREAVATLREEAAAAKASARGAEAASKERAAAERRWGGESELAVLNELSSSLKALKGSAAKAVARQKEAADSLPTLAEEFARANEAALESERARNLAGQERDAAAELLQEARHADMVAAVASGLAAGDPCPVCGRKLTKAPARRSTAGLNSAERALSDAERALRKAEQIAAEAARNRDREALQVDGAESEVERLKTECAKTQADLKACVDRLTKAFGGTMPKDPGRELVERLARLRALADSEKEAVALSRDHERNAALATEILGEMSARLAALVARMEAQPASNLVARARNAGAGTIRATALVFKAPSQLSDAVRVAESAGRFGSGLDDLALQLDEEAAKGSAAESGLLAEAEAAVGDLLASPGTLAGLAEALSTERTRAAVEASGAEGAAERIAKKIENRGTLLAEIAERHRRGRVFKALAVELQANRLIAFLQAEALQLLASAASDRLARLSDGRYRLWFDNDEFLVVDTWNADEARSVRTLSGGETFLASLALALALSEQVRSLSVTPRAGLDSLFLDEGFGALDPESLEVVVEAIEQLGGDGRLVGVITHVRELAERFPRIEVVKSPAGSSLRVVR